MFGRYRLLERLGVGGMAEVFRAVAVGHAGVELEVAVKRMLPHLADDPSFVRQFAREARLAAMLRHPNIVRVHDFGKIGDIHYLAMEYIRGQTLLALLRAMRRVGPPPLGVSIAVLSELCEALDYAHGLRGPDGRSLGIVHRDLSPSNLMVDDAGHVRIIDFGIAKAATADLRTHSGLVKGKTGYMSPEALRARDVDARSDIFSAGVIAYELVTGRRLFPIRDDYQTLRQIMCGAVEPPSRRSADCPPEIDAVVLRALAPEPDDRWQTAGAMRDALVDVALRFRLHHSPRDVAAWAERVARAEDPSERAPSPRRSATVPWGVGAVDDLEVDLEIVDGDARLDTGDDPTPTTRGVAPTRRAPRAAHAMARSPLGAAGVHLPPRGTDGGRGGTPAWDAAAAGRAGARGAAAAAPANAPEPLPAGRRAPGPAQAAAIDPAARGRVVLHPDDGEVVTVLDRRDKPRDLRALLTPRATPPTPRRWPRASEPPRRAAGAVPSPVRPGASGGVSVHAARARGGAVLAPSRWPRWAVLAAAAVAGALAAAIAFALAH